MHSIAVVGAFDRYNYGDLIFPRIIESWVAQNIPGLEIEYYSTAAKDMTHLGGVRSRALTDLPNEKPAAIILAGGQILNATWASMQLNLVPAAQYRYRRLMYRLMGPSLSDTLARASLGGQTAFPWVIPPASVGGVPVAYNAVGATTFSRWSISRRRKLAQDLSTATHLTVRDPETRRQLTDLGLGPVEMSPDSAVLASSLLEVANKAQVNGRTLEDGSYICFQVGRGYSAGRVQTIAQQLEEIARDTGMDVVLLPIGTAAGHEDHEPLSRIHNRLVGRGVNVTLEEAPTVASTLSIISKSKLFVGTSLHGCLTAFSFGLPSVGYARIPKQVHSMRYLVGDEWNCFTDMSDISRAVSVALQSLKFDISKLRDSAQLAAHENFVRLFSTISA